MKQSTKKRLLIAGVVLAVLVIAGIVVVNVAVNKMFSKVTQTISESDLLKDEGSVELPVLPEENDNENAEENIKIKLDAETMKQLESKISLGDKFAVLSLLAKALPSEEYSRLLSFAAGGISREELSEALQILRENLTDDQKEQIKQYYSKYLHLLEE